MPTTRPTKTVTLTPRNKQPYGTSAYSFRFATSDIAVHRNYVDLLYNNCRSLHLNPFNGSNSRAIDLGESTLAAAADDAAADAIGIDDRIDPVVGHTYLEEVNVDEDHELVKFHVDAITKDGITLTWTSLKGRPVSAARTAARHGRNDGHVWRTSRSEMRFND